MPDWLALPIPTTRFLRLASFSERKNLTTLKVKTVLDYLGKQYVIESTQSYVLD